MLVAAVLLGGGWAKLRAQTPDAEVKPQLTLELGHRGNAQSVALSPDGKVQATGATDGVRLWDAATRQPLRTLLKLQYQSAFGLSFSGDGNLLVGNASGLVTVWDLRTNESGRKLEYFGTRGAPIISADGKTVAAVGQYRLNLWDVESGKLLPAPQGADLTAQKQEPKLTALAFSPDSKTLAGAYADKIVMWSVPDAAGGGGELLGTIVRSSVDRIGPMTSGGSIHTLEFAPDGRTLACAINDPDEDVAGIALWDVATRKLKATLEHGQPGAIIHCIGFAADSKSVAGIGITGLKDGAANWVDVWDVATGHRQASRELEGALVLPAIFTPDLKMLIGVNYFEGFWSWDINAGKLLHTMRPFTRTTASVDYLPAGKMLISGAVQNSKLDGGAAWSLERGELVYPVLPGGPSMLSPDGRTLAIQYYQNVILWDIYKLAPIRTLEGLPGAIVGMMSFSRDGKILAAACGHRCRMVRLWNVETGKVLHELQEPATATTASRWYGAVAMAPDGRKLATVSYVYDPERKPDEPDERRLELWDAPAAPNGTWTKSTLLHNKMGLSHTLRFSPDGKSLAADCDGAVMIWHLASGTNKNMPVGDGVHALAFSPDSRLLAAGADGGGRVFEAATGTLKYTLDSGDENITGLNFLSDGKTLAASCSDGSLVMWRATDGQRLATLMVLPPIDGSDSITLDNAEWIAYTPEGYYNGSAGAEKYIGWRVGTELQPAERYQTRFRRPDMVRQTLAGGG